MEVKDLLDKVYEARRRARNLRMEHEPLCHYGTESYAPCSCGANLVNGRLDKVIEALGF